MEYGLPEDLMEVELDGETFWGRPLDAPQLQRLVRAHTTTKIRKGQPVEQFDAVAFGRDCFTRTVARWKGPTLQGQPMECSEEHRALLWNQHTERARDILTAFEDAATALREGRRKN